MAVQAENAFGHLNASGQLIRIEGLGHEIVRSGVHRFQVVGFAFERGEQDQVGVIIVWLLADFSTERQSIHFRHHPVGNHHRKVILLKGLPGLETVFHRDDFVTPFFQRGFQYYSGNLFIFCDQDFQKVKLSSSISFFTQSNSSSNRPSVSRAPATFSVLPKISNCWAEICHPLGADCQALTPFKAWASPRSRPGSSPAIATRRPIKCSTASRSKVFSNCGKNNGPASKPSCFKSSKVFFQSARSLFFKTPLVSAALVF